MKDDIETLRVFINGSGWAREYKEKMLAIMERIAEHVADRDSLRAKLDRATAISHKFPRRTPKAGGCSTEHDFKILASTVWENDALLAELSADAPAQPPQISDEAVEGDDDKLKPCPFCGGEAEEIYIEEEGDNFGGSCICCKTCGASSAVHFDRKENLRSSWNARRGDYAALNVPATQTSDDVRALIDATIPALEPLQKLP